MSAWDVVIIGGVFSGAATASLLRREQPELRVLLVERTKKFDRKVGEATREVSACFLAKRLAITNHLIHSHITKQGLRFWFAPQEGERLEDCIELGAAFQTRLPSYQVDRKELDTFILSLVVAEGAELWRPAKVRQIGEGFLEMEKDGEMRHVKARWIVDASGRAAVLSRKKGLHRQLTKHPTQAIWARFSNVTDFDGPSFRAKYSKFSEDVHASRMATTNHLMGYAWWCWVIPLRGGDTSIGLVYDNRLYQPPEGAHLTERLINHLHTHPVGRELLERAKPVPGDTRAYAPVPFFSEKIAGPGWQLVGDAAGFMDPLYSQGLDYCSWTVNSAVSRIRQEVKGEIADYKKINTNFTRSYWTGFRAVYKDKYHYLGDAELMSAAFLMDVSLFHFGPVREVISRHLGHFENFSFSGPVDRWVGFFMAFYNRRLAVIGARRQVAGIYGRACVKRIRLENFFSDRRVLKLFFRGLKLWLWAEWKLLFLPQLTLKSSTRATTSVPAV